MKQLTAFDEDASRAEELLVLADFEAASCASQLLLQDTSYALAGGAVRQRAAAVLLQSLYELNRFDESLQMLVDHLGSPKGWSLATLLLWVALALDSCQAETAFTVLEKCFREWKLLSPGTEPGNLEDYNQLCQVMLVEVLPKAGKGHGAAVSWLDALAPSLSPSQAAQLRQLIDADGASISTRLRPPALPPAEQANVKSEVCQWSSMDCPDSDSQRQHRTEAPDTIRELHASASIKGSQDCIRAPLAAHASSVSDAAVSVSVPASKATSSQTCMQQPPLSLAQGADGWDAWSYGQAAAAACCAGVTLYAAYVERRALRRWATATASRVKVDVLEMLAAGFKFNPNPVAAQRGGW